MAMLGLSALIAYSLSKASGDDATLLAQTQAACAEVADRTSGGRIEWVAGCGRTIESLEAAANKTLLSFGIRRADAFGEAAMLQAPAVRTADILRGVVRRLPALAFSESIT